MADGRGSSGSARGWRLVAVLLAVMTMMAGHVAWDATRRSASLAGEVRWLRARLGEKRDVIARQRQEMSDVAIAVDRLARTTTSLGDRALEARRLAHMEQLRARTPRIEPVAATFGEAMSPASEDAARTLEELAWLDAQAAGAADSLGVVMALLKERPNDVAHGVPTLWPVRGPITSPFGARTSPWGEGTEMHAGLDISARYGQSVGAAGPGEVVFAGRDGGYGGLVVIDHGGRMHTLYGHLSALWVREGQRVRTGQPIGAVGASGRATGAHLHYEVRVNGAPVDPRRFLGADVPRRTVPRTVAQIIAGRRRS
jgi:murein DD-endopeptidase MepM/ murein hydrolase activator NlpD